jgi:hypothetical protein
MSSPRVPTPLAGLKREIDILVGLVFFGAGLIAASLLIMVGLLGHRAAMTAILPAETWFVISTLLSPVGFVIQDAVADAMTVEAVPIVDESGRTIDEETRKLMHTTMQTLGRVAIIGGSVLVALVYYTIYRQPPAKP